MADPGPGRLSGLRAAAGAPEVGAEAAGVRDRPASASTVAQGRSRTDGEHDLLAETIGHVHGVDPDITVRADLVRCTACGGLPVVGVAIGWTGENGTQCHGGAMLEPGAALSLASMILAAVGAALSTSKTDGAMADLLTGVDMDAEPAALLDGGDS